ncbi:PD-(D/E)XK nuclease family protein [Candidatus Nanohalobium constans]|uniref:PD-D/EXK nuclease superfamily protein n=1 Tax=Candidatus Nanohalobium constans TaxID=2565781 RepID=A0A5Q0UHT6_9ARCH|nr:PD-(D/E)XK nuclease family protein [Candidatus Nanohalobium constans]QGA80495.1 PD-D/EXK nuclease superfamily protein [Candidatus Nanohalobium constans]
METEKAFNPKELAEKVSKYKLVLTVEASLADAVNSYLDDEKVFTPMQLVDADQDFRKKIFLETVEETDLTWKQASYLLENILSCWKHTGELEELLDRPEFDTEEVREIIEILRDTKTPYHQIEDYKLEAETVAVLKEYQFTEIDRKILPDEYDSIESFTEGNREFGEFKVFGSASEIAQSIKENLQELKPENVGIAVKPGTKYEPLIKSVLEAEDIPFQRRSHAQEDEDVRTFLSLLSTGLTKGTVRVQDVRPIIHQLDIRIPARYNNRKLDDLSEAEDFKDLLNAVQYLDFKDAVERYHELTERETKVPKVLEELELMDEQVSQENLNSIRYYLDSFEVEAEERNEGVLLADPTKVSQINREIVFHVGMDTDWMREVEDKDWIEKEEQEQKNLKDFKSLIQSGKSYFLVQDQELNEEIMPCFYFNELIDEEFSSFSELPHTKVQAEKSPEKHGFETQNYSTDSEKIEAISQSGLNSFVQSPRLYFMDQLVSDADQEKFRKGNLFHMYAEYHASNPEIAKDIEQDEIVSLMMEEIDEFADELDLEDLETEFRIGLENIRSYLKNQDLKELELDEYTETEDENIFVKEFPGGNDGLETEAYFKDKELGAKGKVDLILDKNHLVDFKSGRKYTVQKVLKKSHPELYEGEKFPDFQPLLYITFHRQHVEGKIHFTFLHFLNELGNSVNGEDAQTKTTITYHPENFQEKKASMEVFEYMIRDVAKSNDRRKTLEKLGYQQYSNFMEGRNLPEPFNKDKLLKSEFAAEFEEFAKQEVGDYKYVEKGVKKALKKLVDFRMENYFKEDADQMEDFVQEKLEEINEYMDSRFPVDANPDELHDRDLILK